MVYPVISAKNSGGGLLFSLSTETLEQRPCLPWQPEHWLGCVPNQEWDAELANALVAEGRSAEKEEGWKKKHVNPVLSNSNH